MNDIYSNDEWRIDNAKGKIKLNQRLLDLNQKQWSNIHSFNQELYQIFKEDRKYGSEYQPVWVKEYLARKQFYRQNNLPVELNLIIEEIIAESFTSLQKDNHERMFGNDKQSFYYLKEIYQAQQEIEQIKKSRKEQEIQELLQKEIKDYQEKWEQYLATKPLPELPKKQSKIKVLGNKLKTEFKQLVKSPELVKPIKTTPLIFYW